MKRFLAALFLSLCFGGGALAMTVQPVVVDLRMAGRGMSAPIQVENNGPTPLPVEIRIVETDFSPDAVRASDRPSDDLIAFPPQAIIPPGGTQVFRLQYLGDPSIDHSRHYYAEVAQLPVELPEGQSAIQILYNFQVMVNVASVTGGDPALSIENTEVATTPDGKHVAAFTVHNDGGNYGYLSSGQLSLAYKDAAGAETVSKTLSATDIQQTIGFGLVGPGMSRRFVSSVEVGGPDGEVEAKLTTPRGR